MKRIAPVLTLAVFLQVFFLGCSDTEKLLDITDLALDPPSRKMIDTARTGVNAFANQAFAGSTCEQYLEIRDVLRLGAVRVLFNWSDGVQPSPSVTPDFSFYDQVLGCIPDGVDALVILTNVPSWMSDSSNWIDGNPRLTFAELWARVVARRYSGNGKIVAYQVWNEPNNVDFPENGVVQVLTSPTNYVELVALSSNLIKEEDPGRLVLNGSTTAIGQNFPDALNYNKALQDAGILEVVDIFGIHYYGKNYERLVVEVRDFLNNLGKTIWVTESGIQGVNSQLAYVEEVWPFLRENVGAIDRIYYYRYAEAVPPDVAFGLRTADPGLPISDLYVFLRDRP